MGHLGCIVATMPWYKEAMVAALGEPRGLAARNHLRISLAVAAVFCVAVPVRAALVQMSGDLATSLNLIAIPGGESEDFDAPETAEIAPWRDAVGLLINGEYAACASLADPLGYDLVEYFDTTSENTFYVLLERKSGGVPLRGLGTYVVNPNWHRDLNIQAPHPRRDTNTRAESVDMFLQLGAAVLQFAGTHRCANSACSTCSGSTEVCGGCNGDSFFESDSAHFVDSFFQAASSEFAEQISALVSVSLHGFGPCDPLSDTSFVIISNGTGFAVADSLATDIAEEYNIRLAPVYSDELAGSCNAKPGEPEVAWPCKGDPPCGTTNVQGRAINGSLEACSTSVSIAPLPERFIHVEQQLRLRAPPDNPEIPGVSWQTTIDVFAHVFPRNDSLADFDFRVTMSGTVREVIDPLGDGLINVGDAWTVVYVFDSHVQDGVTTDPQQGVYDAIGSISLQIGSWDSQALVAEPIVVYNNTDLGDRYGIVAEHPSSPGRPRSSLDTSIDTYQFNLSLDLQDSTGKVWSSDALPTTLYLGDFDTQDFSLTLPDLDVEIRGGIASVDVEADATLIPTVSEWGLIVLTLLLLAGIKIQFGRAQRQAA